MLFNILIGNTDDHAKNHSFFWDGEQFELSPGYDICPYLRTGQEATQAMTVGEYGTQSTLKNALTSAGAFGLTEKAAQEESDTLVRGIKKYWPEACEHAQLTEFQRK